eukprot:5584077-Alexandrium_andersonii.AAC.1
MSACRVRCHSVRLRSCGRKGASPAPRRQAGARRESPGEPGCASLNVRCRLGRSAREVDIDRLRAEAEAERRRREEAEWKYEARAHGHCSGSASYSDNSALSCFTPL